MKKMLLAGALMSALAGQAGLLTEKIRAKYTVKATDTWCKGQRTVFDFMGFDAWVIEPPEGVKPLEGNPWTWTMQWRTSFVWRTYVPQMLALGYHHVAIDTFALRMNDRGLEVSKAFQDFLVNDLGLNPKARLIGMSWGGFFAGRYAGTYPDSVARLYFDCALLNFRGFNPKDIGSWSKEMPKGGWETDPRMPVNMANILAAAKIPILIAWGGEDHVVDPYENSRRFIYGYRMAGGTNLTVVPRPAYAHHPHGFDLDDPTLVNFMK